MRALFTSASGMMAQQMNLDIIANNLANSSTTGYKQTVAHFQDLLYQNDRTPGAATSGGSQTPTGIQVGLGVSAGATSGLFTQGNLQKSGNDYDVAIKGDGFFEVLRQDGTKAYTRDGGFTIDGAGRLVTSNGDVLQPEIIVPGDKTSFAVAPDGTVSVTRQGSASETVGQLQLTRFVNPSGLQNIGNNLYTPTAASGEATTGAPGSDGLGQILHKMIEMPNVEVIEQMIRMITIQRAYETNSKAVQAADEMLQGANSIKR